MSRVVYFNRKHKKLTPPRVVQESVDSAKESESERMMQFATDLSKLRQQMMSEASDVFQVTPSFMSAEELQQMVFGFECVFGAFSACKIRRLAQAHESMQLEMPEATRHWTTTLLADKYVQDQVSDVLPLSMFEPPKATK